MTSSLLSLQPFAKMKIISFTFTDESRPNLYLPLYCLVQYHPFNQFFPFQRACLGQMKHLERTEARGQNFKTLGFSPGEYFLKYTVSHIGVCHPKGYGFRAFSV